MSKQNSKYPSTFYRVSIKAIIKNDAGEVLVTKENDYAWSFPGGGLEHGESDREALARELYEEVRISDEFSAYSIGTEAVYVDHLDTWVLWIFYEVNLPDGFYYENGDDIIETSFKHPNEFKGSTNKWEQLVYKWGK
jgi:8-oxo-dGTP pyrophosphatase MutT (NUDIX family)